MKQKVIAIVLIAFFVISSIIPASAGNRGKVIHFAKIMPHGRIETFSLNVIPERGENISSAIARKCAQMVKEEMNASYGLYFIISAGEGLHFSIPPSLKQWQRFDIIFSLLPSLIYCSYHGNSSETDIMPLAGGNEMVILGEHRLLCLGFVGIIGWQGMFSYTNTGFAGFTPFFWTDANESMT